MTESGADPDTALAWVGSSEFGEWVRLRFLEKEDKREKVAEVSEVERKWWRRGKKNWWVEEKELRREKGVEEGQKRRRSKRSWETREESKAAKARERLRLLGGGGMDLFRVSFFFLAFCREMGFSISVLL